MAKVRQSVRQVDPTIGMDPFGRPRDPRWATALVLGAVAVLTLVVTGSSTEVPMVLAPVLVGLGYSPRPH